MYIIALYDANGTWWPMYWWGTWDNNKSNAYRYADRDLAETIALELEDGFPGRCVRVIEV